MKPPAQPTPTRESCPTPPPAGIPLLWCSSLHHESAHLINAATLQPVCGARLGQFGNWTIQTDPLRKCCRCMHHEPGGNVVRG